MEKEELLKSFKDIDLCCQSSISIAELEQRAFTLIEKHKKNPETYLTTEDWQTGYMHGFQTCCNILRNRGIKSL